MLYHNICVLAQAMHELGIEPTLRAWSSSPSRGGYWPTRSLRVRRLPVNLKAIETFESELPDDKLPKQEALFDTREFRRDS